MVKNEREQGVRELAYQLWEAEGCPEGRDLLHWFEAAAAIAAQTPGNGRDAAAITGGTRKRTTRSVALKGGAQDVVDGSIAIGS